MRHNQTTHMQTLSQALWKFLQHIFIDDIVVVIHSTIPPDISVENRILGQGASNHVTSEQQQQFGQPKHEQHRLKRCHKLLFSVEELLLPKYPSDIVEDIFAMLSRKLYSNKFIQ